MTKSTLVDQGAIRVAEVEFKIIKVSPETHQSLLKLGSKSETFDDIIKRLIQEHEEQSSSSKK